MRPNPHDSDTHVHPVRLLEAADAILQAEAATPKQRGLVTVWADGRTPAREGFTPHELVEAFMFLSRLGLVEPRDNGRV